MLYVGVILLIILIAAAAAGGYLIYRRKIREQTLAVLLNLSKDYIKNSRNMDNLDAILEGFRDAERALDEAEVYATAESEKELINNLKKDYLDKRNQAVINFYNTHIKSLLQKARGSNSFENKLLYLKECKAIVKEGIFHLPEVTLFKINKSIVKTLYEKATYEAKKKMEKGIKKEALAIYENTLWNILNDDIPNEDLHKMDEIQKFITKIESLEDAQHQ